MRVCEICDKSTTIGVDSTHNYGGGWARRGQRTRKTWKPNLRKVKVREHNGGEKRIRMCMKCYKALRKDKFPNLTLAHGPR